MTTKHNVGLMAVEFLTPLDPGDISICIFVRHSINSFFNLNFISIKLLTSLYIYCTLYNMVSNLEGIKTFLNHYAYNSYFY